MRQKCARQQHKTTRNSSRLRPRLDAAYPGACAASTGFLRRPLQMPPPRMKSCSF